MLNVETELRSEHTEMGAVIAGKQKLVDIQDRRIKSLESSNARLVDALTQLKQKYEVTDEQVKLDLSERGIVLEDDDQQPAAIAEKC